MAPTPQTTGTRSGSRLLPHLGPALCAVASLLVAFVTFAYPYGRDQSAFAYVAHEWRLGHLPFAGAFEIKPPSIYFAFLCAEALFGEGQHAIRVLDYLATVVPTAIACAVVATPEGVRPTASRLGLALLLATLVYYLPFDFWHTAQCESFCSALSVVATAFALKARRPALAGLAVGFFSTLAVSFKPTIALAAVSNAAVLAMALRGRGARRSDFAKAIAGTLLGIAAPVVLVIGYFAAKGALPAMYEALVVTNRQYVTAGTYVHGAAELARAILSGFVTLWVLLVLPLGFWLTRGLRDFLRAPAGRGLPFGAAAMGLCASLLSVVVQFKFFTYHWSVIVGFATMGLLLAIERIRASHGRRVGRLVAFALPLALLVSGGAHTKRFLHTAKVLRYRLATGDDEPLVRSFSIPAYYSVYDSREVARWVSRHAQAGDTLAVRGFEPQIYIHSGLRYGGRFFATTWLTQKQFSTRTASNAREDYAYFRASPPRWVVAFTHLEDGVDAAKTYERLGYLPRHTEAVFTILERPSNPALPEEPAW